MHIGEKFICTHLREDAFEVRVGLHDIGRENEEVVLPVLIWGIEVGR